MYLKPIKSWKYCESVQTWGGPGNYQFHIYIKGNQRRVELSDEFQNVIDTYRSGGNRHDGVVVQIHRAIVDQLKGSTNSSGIVLPESFKTHCSKIVEAESEEDCRVAVRRAEAVFRKVFNRLKAARFPSGPVGVKKRQSKSRHIRLIEIVQGMIQETGKMPELEDVMKRFHAEGLGYKDKNGRGRVGVKYAHLFETCGFGFWADFADSKYLSSL
jgi:hypothetical protein